MTNTVCSNISATKTKINILLLTILLIADICLYTSKTASIYWMVTTGVIITNALLNFRTISIKAHSFYNWITLVYILIVAYGTFYLRIGEFDTTKIIIRYCQCVTYYSLLLDIIRDDYDTIWYPTLYTSIGVIVFLLSRELGAILVGGTRIGDSLSGNTNLVGFSFGMLSLIASWIYSRKKNIVVLCILILLILFAFLSGSKRVIIILAFDLLLIMILGEKSASKWIKVFIAFLVSIYLIFEVPYFYEIIGRRIEAMMGVFLGKEQAYSYSTTERETMLKEAWRLFLKEPVFGNGYNAFWSNTATVHTYSHSNYSEILCSFGLFGLILFYSKHLYILKRIFTLKTSQAKMCREVAVFAAVNSILAIIIDWSQVVFSQQAIWYFPIILACCMNEKNEIMLVDQNNNNNKREGC